MTHNTKPMKLIIANWKMNPDSLKEAESIFDSSKKEAKIAKNIELVVCPPFVYLSNLKQVKNLKLGAQNCFWENQGAYTGEVSPLMLKNLGVEYVIIGHSERRNYMRESDEMVSKKIKIVFENKLIPVLCVGETMEQRARGIEKNVVKEQLQRDLVCLTRNSCLAGRQAKLKTKNFIVAYEPVWAIGTGNYCQPEEAAEMIRFIKEILILNLGQPTGGGNIKVLYGGSVSSENIANYLKYSEIDGALVGGASIKINEFKKLINEVSKAAETESAQK
ncbi:MAG: triose-phosphate isomerase [Candidatus Paceibacterota bacterium]